MTVNFPQELLPGSNLDDFLGDVLLPFTQSVLSRCALTEIFTQVVRRGCGCFAHRAAVHVDTLCSRIPRWAVRARTAVGMASPLVLLAGCASINPLYFFGEASGIATRPPCRKPTTFVWTPRRRRRRRRRRRLRPTGPLTFNRNYPSWCSSAKTTKLPTSNERDRSIRSCSKSMQGAFFRRRQEVDDAWWRRQPQQLVHSSTTIHDPRAVLFPGSVTCLVWTANNGIKSTRVVF